MKLLIIATAYCLLATHLFAQPKSYTTANAHSHNDYEQPNPFFAAYADQFGSIEADVFSVAGSDHLIVGHELDEIRKNPRTLDSLYLLPLSNAIKMHNGHPYADKTRSLQLMIDLKTEGKETLAKLVKTLHRYPTIISNKQVHIVISGNKPDATTFHTYPSFIEFDGNLGDSYSADQLKKIGMISSSFEDYSTWTGKGEFPTADRSRLKTAIDKAHRAGKRVRLWALPDVPAAWKLMEDLGVDYINTDRIRELAAYLNK